MQCCSQVDHQSAARCGIAWHPDGTLLAVPGTENDVVCYDRDEWKPISYMAGEHSARVNLITYSPNGAGRKWHPPSRGVACPLGRCSRC